MKSKIVIHKILIYITASIWMANGLMCKVLGLVQRHQQIVARILGSEYSWMLTKAIGFAEILMAIWIISGFKQRLNTIIQIIVIGVMNALEFFIAPDLLLWGKLNAIFAFLFIVVIGYNDFFLDKRPMQQT